ncbi:hypothetical protein D3C71_1235710 [compost metagenome]
MYGERLDEQETTLGTIRAGIQLAAADQRKLASMQEGIRAALDERQSDLLELRRENQEFQLWADDVLPDAVARMRERPAVTGAHEYAEHLRARRPVRPTSSAPREK